MRFPLVTILLTPPLAVIFWGLILLIGIHGSYSRGRDGLRRQAERSEARQ